MAPVLYGLPASPPCRAVYLLCKATNFPLNHKHVNLLSGEHKKPEFTKLNPQQTVPTLQDEDGYVLWDSHAIMTYLLEKYIKDDSSLYPKDPKIRGIIHQRLHFESGTLFPKMRAIIGLIIYQNVKVIPQDKIDDVKQAYGLAETFLENKKFFAGNQLTIADFSLVASLSSLISFIPINSSEYPRLSEWMKRMESLPYYKEANQEGVDQLQAAIAKKLQK